MAVLIPDVVWLWISIIEATIFTIWGIGILVKARVQYQQKKNKLSQIVFVTLVCMVLALGISISTFSSQLAQIDIDILQYSTIPYTFMMISSYGWFRFSRITFLGEHEHTNVERITLVMAIGTIVFAFMRALLGNAHPINVALYFVRFVWILAYEGLLITLIIVGSIQVKRRIPKGDPYQGKLTDIIYMAIAYAVCSVLYVLDTLYMAVTKIAGNWALFGGQTAFIVFIAFVYRAFFVKPTTQAT